MANNISDELCRVCDGQIECAPTAILLISLVHTLYGHIGPEPAYYGNEGGIKEKEGMESASSEEDFKFRRTFRRRRPRTHSRSRQEKEGYDFIVVGGGTAGCVLASRLSENRNWKVLLIEAGPEEPKMSLIPALTGEFRGSTVDWQYSMRPKKGFCQNRQENGCEVVQGRALGGTSTINDMAYMRGNPADYDNWAKAGNRGWSFNTVLSYFKYSEGNYDKDIHSNKYHHSTKGPLDVGRYPHVDENVDIIMSALNEIGYNYTDINGRDQLGFMRIQTMSYFGERVSSYTAFIEPIRKLRTNLEIVTQALVTKVLIQSDNDEMRAVGVEYLVNGTRVTVRANKEVVVSAGAINSPKLLMLSGLGPTEYLDFLGIKVYRDLPVGGHFQDHLSVCLPIIKLNKTGTTVNFTKKLQDITTYYGKGTGPLSANFQVVAFYETSLSHPTGTPDIEFRFKGHYSYMYYDSMDLCVSLMTPTSQGLVLLNATDPYHGKPLIYPNYLKSPSDRKKILEGLQEAIKLFDTDIFKKAEFDFDPTLILDNQCRYFDSVTDEFWNCLVKQFSEPLHNYAGTCKMGPPEDEEAVVDDELKVYGVKRMRVVDASIMPQITRGSTAAPVIMIAEKASDLIKKFWY